MYGECVSCRYFIFLNEKKEKGECRRYAPRALLGHQGNQEFFFPRLKSTDGCGEFSYNTSHTRFVEDK